jgi:hypothetical protein
MSRSSIPPIYRRLGYRVNMSVDCTAPLVHLVTQGDPRDTLADPPGALSALVGGVIAEAVMTPLTPNAFEVWVRGLGGAQPGHSADAPALGIERCDLYRARFMGSRGTAPAIRGAVLAVPFAVPDAASLADLDAYYEEEHSPMLLEVPGWLRIRRWRLEPLTSGAPYNRLAFHDLATPETFSGPQVRATTRTAWYARLVQSQWFRDGGRRTGAEVTV